MEPDEGTRPAPISWLAHPFNSPTAHLEKNDPRRSGAFSTNPLVLRTMGTPIRRPTVTPGETELAILKRHYPDADPTSPPWHDIRADLLAGGIPFATVNEANTCDWVRMLDRIPKVAPPAGVSESQVEGMRQLWKKLEPLFDSWINATDPGELDPSLTDRDWQAELPYLEWSASGSVMLGLDDSGKCCVRCKAGATIPDDVEPFITTSFCIDGGQRIDEKLLPEDAPPLADYQKAQNHAFRSKKFQEKKQWDEIHERIADPDNPDPIPLAVLRSNPRLAAWLNGENSEYRPSMAEFKILWPAFIERRRRLKERAYVDPASRQRHALQVLSLEITRCEILAAGIVSDSPVTDKAAVLEAYRDGFATEIAEKETAVSQARDRLLQAGFDAPNDWLVFPVEGFESQVIGPEGMAWRLSDKVQEQWAAIQLGIKANLVRLKATSTASAQMTHEQDDPAGTLPQANLAAETTVANQADRSQLGKKQLAALEIVEREGPIVGKVLAKRIKVQESTLRKHIIPAIKNLGVKNDGHGYYVAPRSAT